MLGLLLTQFFITISVRYINFLIGCVKISEFSIEALTPFVTGEDESTEYASGPDLIRFFNSFGFRDVYGKGSGAGLPGNVSRTAYARESLRRLNGKPEFRTAVESLADNRRVNDADVVADKINEIIKHDGFVLEKNLNGVFRISGAELPTPVQVKAHFSEIKQKIIQNIIMAEFSVWVAVAWFTDKEIGNELRKAHKRGVNVQVIVNDDQITQKHGLDFRSKGIEYYQISPDSKWGKKLMHNKFCIIDLKKIIHGSFNWTGNATYNDEGVTTTDSREMAEDFSREFIRLKTRK